MNQKSTNRNHLTHEKSPYLLQHAKNPVNWYPWSEEAFAEAKERDLPIFLSIGYSTCHWCHVMAHESFEDPEIAEILNKNYIAVKVDREERPDIDSVYMKVCQALTGSGGWPLTVIMTPDQKPFWAGTYLPKKAFPGSPIPGLTELLLEISNQWNTNRSTLLHAGNKITDHIRQTAQKNESAAFSKALLRQAADELLQIFDHKWGGFGTAPKFPSPHNLLFLLKQSQFEQNPQAEEAVRFTLNQMYRGGIFDHIGGGFSRYSTDKKWLVPHFEKMLYDNAMLTLAYVEYFRISKDPFYQIVARRVMDYVLSELTSPNGGFYCGQDADSDGIEGKYYVFTPEEIAEVLGDEDGAFFCHWYEVTAPGNFEGKSIPNLLENPDYSTFPPQINPLQEKLYQYRLQRTSLHKDDKILTSWNGLMIAAFAQAARILGDPVYLDAAENASDFLFSHLANSAGDLMIRWRDGQAAHLGQLDDYAFFTLGLLYLYDATLKTDYLTKAISLAEKMVSDFSDEKAGGLFLYSEKGEQLIHRPKESYDGAIPSGNSAAAHVFIRLFHLTGEIKWKTLAEKQCSWIANEADSYLPGFTFGLLAIAELLYPSTQLVCVNAENRIPGELKQYLRDHSGTELSVLFKSPENEKTLTEAAPFTKDYPIPESGSFYYFCENGTCKAPVRTLK